MFLVPAQTIPTHLVCSEAALEKARDRFPAGKWPPVCSQGSRKDYPCWQTGLVPTATGGTQPWGSDPHHEELCPDWPQRKDQSIPAAPSWGLPAHSTPKEGSGTKYKHPLVSHTASCRSCSRQ